MPKLAAFPKAWMQELCVDGSLNLEWWIEAYANHGEKHLDHIKKALELYENKS